MLNINQNFDLKAPVFNFDRDYFNSVEELNAYDTSNVPNYFVTNVAGMLYQFTNGGWWPMIGISEDTNSSWQKLNLGKQGEYGCHIEGSEDGTMNLELYRVNHYTNSMDASYNYIGNDDATKAISLDIDDTDETDEDNGDSTVNMYLTDGSYKATINAKSGFEHKTYDGYISRLVGYGINLQNKSFKANVQATGLRVYNKNDASLLISVETGTEEHYLTFGSDKQFKISRPTNNTEGAVISGIKSLTAFANPSATKVWATDGSTVDLSTKANTSDLDAKANKSDVLLKKSASGGYYIEENSNELGVEAFAANSTCVASGLHSHAEGQYTQSIQEGSHAEGDHTIASGYNSHAEGSETRATQSNAHAEGMESVASGNNSHAEGRGTKALSNEAHAEGSDCQATEQGTHAEGCDTRATGYYSHSEGFNTLASAHSSHAEGFGTVANKNQAHAEGNNTIAGSYAAHAQGTYNINDTNAIHSVGIGNSTTRKNAEYIYAKNNESGHLVDDPKNGYKYLIGVGGYDGISTDNTTYKSVQEVIADLTARIEQLETKVKALEDANTPA